MPEKTPEQPLDYDSFVLLPALRDIHDRLARGRYDRKSWNRILDLYIRLPGSVESRIDWSRVLDADSNKELCEFLFLQIVHELEKAGFLRDISVIKSGYLGGS